MLPLKNVALKKIFALPTKSPVDAHEPRFVFSTEYPMTGRVLRYSEQHEFFLPVLSTFRVAPIGLPFH